MSLATRSAGPSALRRPATILLRPARPYHAPPPSSALPVPLQDMTRAWLGSQPRFTTRADDLQVLQEPQEFYAALLGMIRRAEKRLLISTLYIGDDEHELIDTIRTSLLAHPRLRVTFMLDKNRCTRNAFPGPSTALLLFPLVQEFEARVDVRFYEPPSVMARLFPKRFKEGYGTWHSKVYSADDEVILTGANLSKDYFTTRQDRYFHLHRAPQLVSYLASLMTAYSPFTYRLSPRSAYDQPLSALSSGPLPYEIVWGDRPYTPLNIGPLARDALRKHQRDWSERTAREDGRGAGDTTVWPVVQVGYLGLNEEERRVGEVWTALGRMVREGKESGAGDRTPLVDLTSGYFGLAEGYRQAVLRCGADVRIVAASPKANGFYGSKGISGLIPEGYTLLESQFERQVRAMGRDWQEEEGGTAGEGHGVEISEWEREGWTYHAKGMWVSPSSRKPPALTLIGSTNLSPRSLSLDAETSFLIATTSGSLRASLAEEVGRMRQWSEGRRVGEETWLSEERRVGWKVRRLIEPFPRGLGVGSQL